MVARSGRAGSEHDTPDQGRGARADVGLRATRRAAGRTVDGAGRARSAGDVDDRAAGRLASLTALDLPSIAARGSRDLRSTGVRQPSLAKFVSGGAGFRGAWEPLGGARESARRAPCISPTGCS